LYAHTAAGHPECRPQYVTVTVLQREPNIPFEDCCFDDSSTSAESMHCRSLCRTQMSAVPDHLLEVVFGQLRVSDCAACCCVSQELKALAQVHCRLCCALDPRFAVPEPRIFAGLQARMPIRCICCIFSAVERSSLIRRCAGSDCCVLALHLTSFWQTSCVMSL